MNVGGWLLWGFVATLVLTSFMAATQGLSLTRMSLPYILGAMFTPSRDRAKLFGFLVHLANGWIFSLLYVAAFHSWNHATWWLGVAIGFVHATFVLTAGMRILPGIHPRMASEQQGPTIARQLEPPGFLALNYGSHTPLSVLGAHLLFGAIIGLSTVCLFSRCERSARASSALLSRSLAYDAEHRGKRALRVRVGRRPRRDADPHRDVALPRRAAAPARAVPLDGRDDVTRAVGVAERDDHLVQHYVIQDAMACRR